MSDYTPDSGTVRYRYVDGDMSGGNRDSHAEFDRFIAKVKADALREAANALLKPTGLRCNPNCHTADWASLRVRADLIESGDGQ